MCVDVCQFNGFLCMCVSGKNSVYIHIPAVLPGSQRICRQLNERTTNKMLKYLRCFSMHSLALALGNDSRVLCC